MLYKYITKEDLIMNVISNLVEDSPIGYQKGSLRGGRIK